MPTITPSVGALALAGLAPVLVLPSVFVPCPRIAAIASTGTGTGAGKMTNSAINTIGAISQNNPFTNQPSWVVSPSLSGSTDGTDVYSTG